MLRKMLCATFVLAISGFVLADEFTASVTKVADGKVTYQKMKKGKADGDAVTLPTTSDCKILKGKFNKDTKKLEPGDAVEGGLKAEMFTTIGDKGVTALITTDADNKNITQIVVGGGKKKKAAN